ncbi:Uncharacterised protein [Brevibacterium casei]|uniref:Uncharacterized protein n=1 Tax=Brevibacterium casei TaxID=33889 RepID=A0A449D7E9_9MICO|nr:hypothetical protein [Brevibacterium casei]VEW13559.1 Uncharacterised protein [Brevibacterium casei]
MPVHEWVKARRKSDGAILPRKLPKSIVEASPLLSEIPSSRNKKREEPAVEPEKKETKK